MTSERKNGLLDPGGDEMHRHPGGLQRANRLFGAGHQRGSIHLAKLLDACERRLDDLEPLPVDLIERNLSVHRGIGEACDLRIPTGELVDAFDRYECGVDVEENESKSWRGQCRAPLPTRPIRSENRSSM
jgi:hypothetical protein